MIATMTKEQELWDKLPSTPFSSHHVREIGFSMWYDRADRTVRQWASENKLKKISHEECILLGLVKKGKSPLAWWIK